ncbi:MAG: Lrp/AsnC family transcriptional regulator [Bryobacterales bacterium]|nr:Lrp/AsnC family transcriptional regulator [Bryobacterales bacterium]
MNTLDRQALKLLMRRGRMSWADLAAKLDLSAPSATDRVKKLEESGVIRGYAALVDAGKVGLGLTAFIAVSLDQHTQREKFLKRIQQMTAVLECHHVAGEYDFLLKVKCGGTGELERLLTEELKGKAGAGRTMTTIVLGTHKETVELGMEE